MTVLKPKLLVYVICCAHLVSHGFHVNRRKQPPLLTSAERSPFRWWQLEHHLKDLKETSRMMPSSQEKNETSWNILKHLETPNKTWNRGFPRRSKLPTASVSGQLWKFQGYRRQGFDHLKLVLREVAAGCFVLLQVQADRGTFWSKKLCWKRSWNEFPCWICEHLWSLCALLLYIIVHYDPWSPICNASIQSSSDVNFILNHSPMSKLLFTLLAVPCRLPHLLRRCQTIERWFESCLQKWSAGPASSKRYHQLGLHIQTCPEQVRKVRKKYLHFGVVINNRTRLSNPTWISIMIIVIIIIVTIKVVVMVKKIGRCECFFSYFSF